MYYLEEIASPRGSYAVIGAVLRGVEGIVPKGRPVTSSYQTLSRVYWTVSA